MKFEVGEKVRFKKRRCCGRVGFDWTIGVIRKIREFEGSRIYSISGYGRYVRENEMEKIR